MTWVSAALMTCEFSNPHRDLRRRVEQTADTDHGVDAEAGNITEAVVDLTLQSIIDDGDGIVDVRQEIGDAPAHRLRRYLDGLSRAPPAA